jgi:hypothetical protein
MGIITTSEHRPSWFLKLSNKNDSERRRTLWERYFELKSL